MVVWQVVVKQPYESVKALELSAYADNVLFAEHGADGSTKRIHTHVVLDGVKVGRAAIEKRIKKFGYGGRGNYAILTECKDIKEPYDRDKLCVYVLKGNKDLCKQTTYSDEQIVQWVSQWQGFGKRPAEKLINHPAKSALPKPDMSHWAIMEVIREETRSHPGVWTEINQITTGDDGLVQEPMWVCNNRKHVWNVMIKHLTKHKIRTSKNELERFWVSMMREEQNTSHALYSSIMRKLYET